MKRHHLIFALAVLAMGFPTCLSSKGKHSTNTTGKNAKMLRESPEIFAATLEKADDTITLQLSK